MKQIKTMPRFRCDFCRHTGIKRKMLVHEKVCWRNPNRHCDLCNDTGFVYTVLVEGSNDPQFLSPEYGTTDPCVYCSKFDPLKVPPLPDQPLLTHSTND